jgi:GTP-binding protein EngB required for normal cell division
VRALRGNKVVDPAGELSDRVDALAAALVAAGSEVDPAEAARASAVVDKVGERIGIAGAHTVVALAGATGSGKSSLFNALVGSEVARVGARRPTTSKPTAAVWGDADARELLDWLQVDARHLVGASAESGPSLDGLVLVDMPDFDSREEANRVEAERMLELVDVFIWVTDPQKYADARLHDDFVQVLSQHESVTLAVLNQADRLTPESVRECTRDLGRLLERDGIAKPKVFAASTRTGQGVEELRGQIADAVAGNLASRRRLSADVVASARTLRGEVADRETQSDRLPRKDLDTSLSKAAGVPIVLDAVSKDYRRAALARSGWLFSRWVGRRGPDPLRRLRLAGAVVSTDDSEDVGARAVLGRSSIPSPTSATRASVDVAIRAFGRSAADGLPARWERAIQDAATSAAESLPDELDQAVLGTSLKARRPAWWAVANLLQWLVGLVALAGVLWLAGLYVLGLLAFPRPETPSVGVVPVPFLLVAGGVLVGMCLAGLARWWARVGARRRRAVMASRLRASIAGVTAERIVEPIATVLDRHRATREQLDRAAR